VIVEVEQVLTLKYTVTLVEVQLCIVPQLTDQLVAVQGESVYVQVVPTVTGLCPLIVHATGGGIFCADILFDKMKI
jgi:hypothetical protein